MPLEGPYLMLIEYRWSDYGEKYTRKGDTAGDPAWPADWIDGINLVPSPSPDSRKYHHVFYFIPRPSQVRKNIQMMWKVAHSGTKRLKRARFRNRESLELRLSGSFSENLRAEFEYYLKQESKFWVINDYVQTPNPENHRYEVGEDPNGVFVIIKSANFSGSEGQMMMEDYETENVRVRRVNYEIILERTNRDDLDWQ